MEITVHYDNNQLQLTVDYIAAHHQYPETIDIKEQVLSTMKKLVDNWPKLRIASGVGYYIYMTTWINEGIDSDENSLYVEFLTVPTELKKVPDWTHETFYRKIP